MILNKIKCLGIMCSRTYKNFGHKRQPVPTFTLLWQTFLTFTFIGLGIEWKKYYTLQVLRGRAVHLPPQVFSNYLIGSPDNVLATFFFGEDHDMDEVPWQAAKRENTPQKETGS